MALEFKEPPAWLMQEYLNRKDPLDKANEMLAVINQGIDRRQTSQDRTNAFKLKQAEAAREERANKLAEFKAIAYYAPEDQIPALASKYGIDMSGGLPPVPSSGTATSPMPMDAGGRQIMGPQQGPQLPGVGLGMKAQQEPTSGMGAPSTIDHWTSWSQNNPTKQPVGGQGPVNPLNVLPENMPTSKAGIGKLKSKLEMAKLTEGFQPEQYFDRNGNKKFEVPANAKILPPESNKDETRQERLSASLRKELTGSKPYERFSTLKAASENIENAVKDPGAFGDLSMLFDYMKVLDPISVVREGEQEAFRKTGSLTQSMANTLNKVVSGKTVTKEQRDEVLKYTKSRLKTAHGIYKSHTDPTLKQTKRMGIDPYEVDPYFDYKIDEGEADTSGPHGPSVVQDGVTFNWNPATGQYE